MQIFKNHKYLPIILLIMVFIAGLAVGCSAGRVSKGGSKRENTCETTEETALKKTIYESHSALYISNSAITGSPSISSSDLHASQGLAYVYAEMLQSKLIRTALKEKFPDSEFELASEVSEYTEVFRIIVTSESPDDLKEICDLATSLLCETVSTIVDGSSCKIIDAASKPKPMTDPT